MASEPTLVLELLRPNAGKLEHEFDLIRSAVALVGDGGAGRVTLVGMSMDEADLLEARFLLRASGMVMRAEKSQAGFDVTIEAGG